MRQTHIKRTRCALSALCGTVLVAALSVPATAIASPASEAQAEAEAALASLNSMQQELDRASNDYYAALDEQAQAEQRADEAQVRIDEASGEIAGLQDRLGSRARTMYRDGQTNFIDILLGATSFQEFATGLSLLNTMNENDAELVQQSKDLRAEIESEQAEYVEQSQRAAEKAEEAASVKAEAETTVAAMTETYNNLSDEAAELLAEEQAAQAAAAAAAAEAAAVAAESGTGGAAAGDGRGGGSASAPSSPSGSTPSTPSAPSSPSTPSAPSAPSSPSSNAPSYNGSVASTVVNVAYSKINCPYVWGASGPNSFDCSGLVQYCYAQAGVSVAHYTGALICLPQVSNPQPGDICVVHEAGGSQHTGIYIGGGQMIHAPMPGQSVCVSSVQPGMVYVRPNY